MGSSQKENSTICFFFHKNSQLTLRNLVTFLFLFGRSRCVRNNILVPGTRKFVGRNESVVIQVLIVKNVFHSVVMVVFNHVSYKCSVVPQLLRCSFIKSPNLMRGEEKITFKFAVSLNCECLWIDQLEKQQLKITSQSCCQANLRWWKKNNCLGCVL